MVAGLRGSSSGMPASTLPTRSAPTSAALVNMPPPTRAKRACKLAPMPKVSIVVVMMIILCASLASSIKWLSTKNQTEMSRSARPTTTSPITAPERNATRRPWSSEFFAAHAARFEAYVAVFIPKKPARPEKKPPVMKAKGTHSFCMRSPYARNAKNANIMMNTRPTTLYCCFKYAKAPILTCRAILRMMSVPSSSFFIPL